MNMTMNHFDLVEEKLNQIIKQSESLLPETTVSDAKDLFDNREYGVALELICQQLFEYDVAITRGLYVDISDSAKIMKMPESTHDFLKTLVLQV